MSFILKASIPGKAETAYLGRSRREWIYEFENAARFEELAEAQLQLERFKKLQEKVPVSSVVKFELTMC